MTRRSATRHSSATQRASAACASAAEARRRQSKLRSAKSSACASPRWNLIVVIDCSAARCRAIASISSEASTAVTLAPPRARSSAARPVPVPTSRMLAILDAPDHVGQHARLRLRDQLADRPAEAAVVEGPRHRRIGIARIAVMIARRIACSRDVLDHRAGGPAALGQQRRAGLPRLVEIGVVAVFGLRQLARLAAERRGARRIGQRRRGCRRRTPAASRRSGSPCRR